QNALAHAAAGEQSQALSAPHGEKRIDGAHPDVEYMADRCAIERVGGPAVQGNVPIEHERTPLVERTAGAVHYPTEHAPSDRHLLGTVLCTPPRYERLAQARNTGRSG